MSCPIEQVLAVGFSLGVPWGPALLTTGSLVREVDGDCPGTSVEVVAANPVYASGVPLASGVGCVDPALLGPAWWYVALADHGPYRAGELVGALPDDCAARLDDFATLRPIDASALAGVERVRSTYERLFGPIGREQIPWTEWGRVGLPMTLYSVEQRWEEADIERLDTPDRFARGPVGDGPSQRYYHFRGGDPPDSDRYGTPEAVSAFLELADGWFRKCTRHHAAARCRIGVGDIGWFAPAWPDPLGHKEHWRGECFDIRPFRRDQSRYETHWNQPDDRTGRHVYDRGLTREFVRYAKRPVTGVGTLFFDDPRVLRRPRGMPRREHPDHLHVCFDADHRRPGR